MKLLFDQNLSDRLCRLLADVFPDANHVRLAGLESATDDAIWKFARDGELAIVTLDADFSDMATLRRVPPKVIWLRCGNQPTAYVEQLIRNHSLLIESFGTDANARCLELY